MLSYCFPDKDLCFIWLLSKQRNIFHIRFNFLLIKLSFFQAYFGIQIKFKYKVWVFLFFFLLFFLSSFIFEFNHFLNYLIPFYNKLFILIHFHLCYLQQKFFLISSTWYCDIFSFFSFEWFFDILCQFFDNNFLVY
jgi:hypothetical protein